MDNDIVDGVSYTVKLGDTYKNSLNIKWRTLDCQHLSDIQIQTSQAN
jgi:hypothetical protein